MFAAQTGHYSMEYLSKQISYQSVSERVRGRVRECVCMYTRLLGQTSNVETELDDRPVVYLALS